MRELEADIAVVGSGICGLLSAWAPLEMGKRVVVLERGGLKTHAEQLEDREWRAAVPGAEMNHETASGTRAYPWNYVYGVGGSSLHWSGATPRFVATDFTMRSSHGVMRDWPLSLDEMAPYYRRAEAALGVAGATDRGADRSERSLPGTRALPAHPLSPMDRVVAPYLKPYGPLPQARPSRPLGGRPACCGSATCELCPVDARFSALNGLRPVLDHPGLDLQDRTIVTRLRIGQSGRRVDAIEAIGTGGEQLLVRADRYVLAAGGFENPAILLRSRLERSALGRYLFDHAHTTLIATLGKPVGPGRGDTLATGLSEAFREGSFRSRRSGAIVSPFNPGAPLSPLTVDEAVSGRSGEDLRKRVQDRWNRTLPLDVLTEDLPQAERRVTLGRKRDSFGLPLIRVAYPPSTPYEVDGIRHVAEQVRRRLAPLGAGSVEVLEGPRGGHLLGTCRMGDGDDSVVDADLRHLDLDNLHVAGGSAFPTYSPVHPTLTIAALALRLGDLLSDRT